MILVGENTSFKATSTVDFGAGITVGKAMSIGGTGLVVEITVAPDAALGPRAVTVDGLTLAAGYTLEAPISTTMQGTLAQGSVVFLTIDNLDKANPFDTSTDDDGNYTGIAFTAPAGVEILTSNVTATTIEAAALIDVDATAGTFSLASGFGDSVATSIDKLEVAPRAAMALTANTPATGMQTEVLGTHLFEFTPATGPVAISAWASTANADANPEIAVLGPSGHFADGFQIYPIAGFFGPLREKFSAIQKTPQKFYAIYLDRSGTSNYQFSVTANAVTLTPVNEQANAHATVAAAQAVSKTALIDQGLLATQGETDVYKLTIAAADVGKKVHVVTSGDPMTDTVVKVAGGTAGGTAMGESDDLMAHEDFTSDPIPAGTTTVYVTVTTSTPDYFDPAHGSYMASIVLE